MSKERELLKRLVHWCWQVEAYPHKLHEEIEELLAQPEQSNEPVAWSYDYDGTTWVKLKEPDLPNMHHSVTNIRPLYTSPPTREPLSADEIQDALIKCRQSTTWDYGFEVGVKWTEFMYGIGENNGSV